MARPFRIAFLGTLAATLTGVFLALSFLTSQPSLEERSGGREKARLAPVVFRSPGAYQFLSPNTDENLTLDEASRRLHSERHQEFRRLTLDLLTQLGVEGSQVVDALGDCSDGVENSVLVSIPEPADFGAVRYAAARLGLAARQKWVLTFRAEAWGKDCLAQLDLTEKTASQVRKLLDEHGVAYRTLVPLRSGHRIVVVDEGRKLSGSLQRLAAGLRVPVLETPGTGELLGDETRERAGRRFEQVVRDFEESSGRLKARLDGLFSWSQTAEKHWVAAAPPVR